MFTSFLVHLSQSGDLLPSVFNRRSLPDHLSKLLNQYWYVVFVGEMRHMYKIQDPQPKKEFIFWLKTYQFLAIIISRLNS